MSKDLREQPLIGVVVPIYNVAAYLRECLDSIINQTYKNISVILVNDGSTDNGESLAIAKEYVSKDSRFILFDKENGGQSTARNVGIEWFREKYQVKLESAESINSADSLSGGGSQEISIYTITNDNPYKIHRIYAHKELGETLTPKYIEWINFLDSDDYWRGECLEECIKHSDGVEIVSFNYEAFYDGIEAPKEPYSTWQDFFHYADSGKYTKLDWLDRALKHKIAYFAWAWRGIVNFSFLKNINLYFLNGVFAEDVLFGTLLFYQSNNFYVLHKPLYVYRVRQNSSSSATKSTPINPYIKHIYKAFKDAESTRKYHQASSWFIMLLELMEFCKNNPNPNNEILAKAFFPHFAKESKKLLELEHDPLNLIPKLLVIEPYLDKKFNKKERILIKISSAPIVIKVWFNLIIKINKQLKNLEKTFRHNVLYKIKGKKAQE